MKRVVTSVTEFNTRHLPLEEYQNLVKFYIYPSDYPILSSLYSSGVIILIMDKELGKIRNDFPVLHSILVKCIEHEIQFVDFSENCFISDLKTYPH